MKCSTRKILVSRYGGNGNMGTFKPLSNNGIITGKYWDEGSRIHSVRGEEGGGEW